MKPFNLEEAKAGKPVCTRDGRPVRILAFDANVGTGEVIAALVPRAGNGDDMFLSYFVSGRHYSNREGDVDLFMAPTTKTVWVNLYQLPGGRVCTGQCAAYDSEDAARRWVKLERPEKYIGTLPITYEE